MDPVEALTQLGGVARSAPLRALTSRRVLNRAILAGLVHHPRRDCYTLPTVQEHRRLAHAMTAVLSHESAALHYGWAVVEVPDRAQVVVRRNRNLSRAEQATVDARWRRLAETEVRDGVTVPLRTVLDCARDLPFPRALAVADAALRARDITSDELGSAVQGLQGAGRRAACRVAAQASGLAANPFESVLRSIALDVPGLRPVAQLRIREHGLYATVDVGDESLRLALEGDSWSEHGGRRAFRKDCRRYDELVAWGWTVFRFTWEDVMLQPEFVRWCLESWLASRAGGVVLVPPRALARLA